MAPPGFYNGTRRCCRITFERQVMKFISWLADSIGMVFIAVIALGIVVEGCGAFTGYDDIRWFGLGIGTFGLAMFMPRLTVSAWKKG